MQRALIPSDSRHPSRVRKEELRHSLVPRLAYLLLLGIGLPLCAQVSQTFRTASEFSNYEQSDGLSIRVPLRPLSNLGTIVVPPHRTDVSVQQLQSDSGANFKKTCAETSCSGGFDAQQQTLMSQRPQMDQPKSSDSGSDSENSKAIASALVRSHYRPDINDEIYRRNRLDFGLDVGWHPVNIPFIYDFAVGDSYNMTPLKYTLVPIIASLRWQVTKVGWPWILRGNMDFTFSGSITVIPRGPETHYYAFMFGIRRNFVHRNWKAVPFFEQRGGAGMIDAKEPLGVLFSQGQNLTFTYCMGAGVRYNLNTKYSFSAGMNYMHISNGYLSEPQFTNYGINVYGPIFGFDMRLRGLRHASQ